MTQSSAVITLDVDIALIPGSTTAAVASENVSLSTTVGGYAAAVITFANAIWQNYLVPSGYATPTATASDPLRTVDVSGGAKASLVGLNYVIKIQNVTAPTPPYSSQGFVPEKEERWTGTIGPSDFTGPVDLGAALSAAIAHAVAFTNYG